MDNVNFNTSNVKVHLDLSPFRVPIILFISIHLMLRFIVYNELKRTGCKADRQGFGVIEFGEKDLNASLKYVKTKAETVAYKTIPYVLKHGIEIEIDGHENHKKRGYDTVTFAAPP